MSIGFKDQKTIYLRINYLEEINNNPFNFWNLKFNLLKKDKNTKARAATLTTDHGVIETPIFMPVGTLGTVKGVHQRELKNDINPDIILGNTYHLYLRPQIEILEKAGGLHKFMNWDRNILTDSGGYHDNLLNL